MNAYKQAMLELIGRTLLAIAIAAIAIFIWQGNLTAQTKPLLFLPFTAGQDWLVVQGQNGAYSHYGNQAYGYDFVKASGTTFGQPVLAPANCTVTELRQGVADYQNNSSSNLANHNGWGNTVVCRTSYQGYDYYMRFAHLMQNSTSHLAVGTYVSQGDRIGNVGQTGYSTNPHLHFQVQLNNGTPSINFDFVEGGRLDRNEVVTSRLNRNLWVVDNYGRFNAGAGVINTSTATSQSWTYWSEHLHSIGTYATVDTTSATYEWRFSLFINGTYDLYASCPAAISRSSRVQYTFTGMPSYSKTFFVDQRYHTSTSGWAENLYYLGYISSNGGSHKLRLSNVNSGRMCADAIFIRKR